MNELTEDCNRIRDFIMGLDFENPIQPITWADGEEELFWRVMEFNKKPYSVIHITKYGDE